MLTTRYIALFVDIQNGMQELMQTTTYVKARFHQSTTKQGSSMLTSSDGFFAIEDELQRRRELSEKYAGQVKLFRVEFRFKNQEKAWEYFPTCEEAESADDYVKCKYSIMGNPVIEYPKSRQVQVKGKRGGWSKYTPSEDR